MQPMKSLLVIATMLAPSLAFADTGPAPRPGTMEAMHCLLRQAPRGCETIFVGGARVTAKSWVFDNPDRDFKRGALTSSSYFGPATAASIFDVKILNTQPTREMDIYDVKFAHVEYSLYIAPPDAEGKINALAISLYGPRDMHRLEP